MAKDTETIRNRASWDPYFDKHDEHWAKEFDAWLEAHDREVKAQGHREGYETARQDMISGAFVGGPTFEALRASFTGQRIARDAEAVGYQKALQRASEGLLEG
jgi:hypothetical protein